MATEKEVVYDLDDLGKVENEETRKEDAKKKEPEAKKEDPVEEEEEKEEGKSEEDDEKEIVEEKEEEEEEDKQDDPEKDKTDKKEKPEEVDIDEDEFIANHLKDYEITTMDDLLETLEGVDKLAKAYEELKAKPSEPVFQSESQKKAYEFITKSGYDPSKFGEGLLTHAKLVSMDLKNSDPKLILEEEYVVSHPELTREESKKAFERKYNRTFVVDKAKFDDDKEYEEEKEQAEIALKSEVAKARKVLEAKQAEYKADPKKEDKEEDDESISPVIESGIKKTVGDFNSFIDGFSTIIFQDEKNPDNEFKYEIPKKYLKQIQEAGTRYLSRPESYNEKGVIPEHDPEQYAINVAFALIGKEIVSKALKHVDQKASIKKAEDIAKVKPNKPGGKVDGRVESMDFMQGAEILAEQKERQRGRR